MWMWRRCGGRGIVLVRKGWSGGAVGSGDGVELEVGDDEWIFFFFFFGWGGGGGGGGGKGGGELSLERGGGGGGFNLVLGISISGGNFFKREERGLD